MSDSFRKLAGYHDAELIGVTVQRDSNIAELRFERIDGTTATITLNGLVDFRLVDLVRQNVVSRLMIHDATSFSAQDIRSAITWAQNLSDTQIVPSEEHLENVIESVRQGDLSVLILEPSAGAELVASFGSFTENIER
jgi:hypothetical protein